MEAADWASAQGAGFISPADPAAALRWGGFWNSGTPRPGIPTVFPSNEAGGGEEDEDERERREGGSLTPLSLL